jgi:hypothetical protein
MTIVAANIELGTIELGASGASTGDCHSSRQCHL